MNANITPFERKHDINHQYKIGTFPKTVTKSTIKEQVEDEVNGFVKFLRNN